MPAILFLVENFPSFSATCWLQDCSNIFDTIEKMEDSPIIRKALREILIRWRAEMHLSQEKMANRCGISRTHLSRLETCTESTTLATVQQILEGCGKHWTDFGKAMDEILETESPGKIGKLAAEQKFPYWPEK